MTFASAYAAAPIVVWMGGGVSERGEGGTGRRMS